MAIYLEANYSKKLGLPGYSSHQYSLTVKTELTDPAQVQAQSTRLYNLLQSCVDREIQMIGFLPGINGNGSRNGNGSGNSAAAACQLSDDHEVKATGNGADGWACSQKQQALILKIVAENSLDKNQVEAIALDKFGKSVRALNKVQASGLIEELHCRTSGNSAQNQRQRLEGRATPANSQ